MRKRRAGFWKRLTRARCRSARLGRKFGGCGGRIAVVRGFSAKDSTRRNLRLPSQLQRGSGEKPVLPRRWSPKCSSCSMRATVPDRQRVGNLLARTKPWPHGNLADENLKRGTGLVREPHGVHRESSSPWNYPFSIPATETLAALVAGKRRGT